MIESLREQKDREERVRLEELEQMRKENRELKDKLAALQPQKLSQTQASNPNPTQNQRPDGEVSMDRFGHEWCVCYAKFNLNNKMNVCDVHTQNCFPAMCMDC